MATRAVRASAPAVATPGVARPAAAHRTGPVGAEQALQLVDLRERARVGLLDHAERPRDVAEAAQVRVEVVPALRHGAQRGDVGDGEAGRVRDGGDAAGGERAGLLLAGLQGLHLGRGAGAVADEVGGGTLGGAGGVQALGGGDDEVALGAGGVPLQGGEGAVDVPAPGGASRRCRPPGSTGTPPAATRRAPA